MTEKQNCLQCGKCCEKWGWDQKGIVDDIILWLLQNRKDILQHVLIHLTDGKHIRGAVVSEKDFPNISSIHYWIGANGRMLDHCPFFERRVDGKVYCRIHTLKPAVCQGFAPWNDVWHDYGLNCPACKDTAP